MINYTFPLTIEESSPRATTSDRASSLRREIRSMHAERTTCIASAEPAEPGRKAPGPAVLRCFGAFFGALGRLGALGAGIVVFALCLCRCIRRAAAEAWRSASSARSPRGPRMRRHRREKGPAPRFAIGKERDVRFGEGACGSAVLGLAAQAHAGDLCKVLRDANQEVPKATLSEALRGSQTPCLHRSWRALPAPPVATRPRRRRPSIRAPSSERPESFMFLRKSGEGLFPWRSFGWHEVILLM